MVKQVNVLGTNYKIYFKDYKDRAFCDNGVIGYCDMILKEIVLCNLKTCPNYCKEDDTSIELSYKETLRHEILHAFLNESGLDASSLNTTSWATNEEMVDWFAIQSPKIFKAYTECEIL